MRKTDQLARDLKLRTVEAMRLIRDLGSGALTVNHVITANAGSPRDKVLFGKGKIQEVATQLKKLRLESSLPLPLVFLDHPRLAPRRLKELEDAWSPFRVVDRFAVILRIFEARAVTTEARLQVELAQLP